MAEFSGNEDVKMVLVVRNDLKMTKGKACAQVARLLSVPSVGRVDGLSPHPDY